ncbi:serpin B3 [Biomphalaria glabrata]|uniref:Serpin B3-like n=1 Tax=Biomphalaria glabrata TaxID=6526 RepID=A0A9U8E220_BIOGL|nr:serpin B3-like [Biomphalaria glabrata]KAI8737151.1 serpin B3-like [Biomphalaria glabrata]
MIARQSAVTVLTLAFLVQCFYCEDPKLTSMKRLTNASNLFARSLYSHVVAKEPMAIYSPSTAHTCLSMVYLGSRESTADQMKRSLKLHNVAGPHATYKDLTISLNSLQSDQVLMTSALWINSKYRVKPEYKTTVGRQYFAEVKNFSSFSVGGPDFLINAWARDKTRGKISSILPQAGISQHASLILISALFFNFTWTSPFDKDQTSKMDFYRANGTPVQVDMMRQVSNLDIKISAVANADVIKLPLTNPRLALYLVLPRSVSGLHELETSVNTNSADFEAVFHGFQNTRVDLTLPRFSVSTVIRLKNALSNMGMPNAFSEFANFSAISESPLTLLDVVQKTVIEVQESGTVAAPLSLPVSGYSPPLETEPPLLFKADHPFMFFLRDDTTNLIILQGRLSDPTVRSVDLA